MPTTSLDSTTCDCSPSTWGILYRLFAEREVEQVIRQAFSYAFSDRPVTHEGAVPQLEFHTIDGSPFEVLGVRVTPIRLQHGPHFQVLGFRINDLAYCTDTNEISASSLGAAGRTRHAGARCAARSTAPDALQSRPGDRGGRASPPAADDLYAYVPRAGL